MSVGTPSETSFPMGARIVGVDYGEKRIGLAIADPFRLFAQAFGTFSPQDALAELARMAETEGIEILVIGWPLEKDGAEGPAVDRVKAFIKRLRRVLPDAELVRWDERFSSKRAAQVLVDAGVRKGARRIKGRLDQASAAIILQEYLDEHNPDSPFD